MPWRVPTNCDADKHSSKEAIMTRSIKWKWTIAGAIGLVAMLLAGTAMPQQARADGVKVGEVGGWNINIDIEIEDLEGFFNDLGEFANKAWKRLFTNHKTYQQVFTIDGKHIVAVPVRSDAGGTRLTHNINFDPAWTKETWVYVVVANVPEGRDPTSMTFQQKYDENWGSDPNIGPNMKHGDRVHLNPGHGRYMASRSDSKYWGSVILFVEDGITPEQLAKLPGNIKVNWNK
jgi:hypothetical protein